MEDRYTGYISKYLNDKELADLYNGQYNIDLLTNEYLLVEGADGTVVDYFKMTSGRLQRVTYPIIKNQYIDSIKPQDNAQYCAIDLLQDRTIPVKIIRGVYGSGKDYLMFNEALSLVEQGQFNKIVFIRPNVTLANVPSIGYLPKGIQEKLGWTMAPLYDKIGGEEGIANLERNNQFEMVPLLFVRGRSFEKSIVYVTEAQNIDSSIAKILLSRVGDGSEIWLNGDNHSQTDSVVFDKDNGLKLMIDKLSGNELFGQIYLPTTHRSKIANLSNLLDE